MKIETTALDGVLILMPQRVGDECGWFSATYNSACMATAGVPVVFVQDNHWLCRKLSSSYGLADMELLSDGCRAWHARTVEVIDFKGIQFPKVVIGV
ncbi:dTDP-4-dehydrorhamnose 3,5-epimerase family protein [Cypionkella sp.]|uniref:dTDP-4-dehydrorhamnose 3,5-epimerase family protein n=1 Tax=Cypionkella sp. TaxID=2811411 RepID=UPI000BDD9C5F|nr:dTDP-4-dehydrorhamnose 3,5-epimerase family protein [Cypionkella sp.]MDO8982368.1 dTDP-4-dehydrorhamnose 3,5-epimerase family protein [Cypionkella sp.]MDP1577397.1 dTDP-4-dehydrorhamnose 3,5-epimerase family protein [Cypionkella sp.]MDP2050618.1 dTDP-4-dehydrorhamnose 3,5-epimerase family protein [Cypionkella sp.]OZA19376.1 MAG: hypothetical protein B7Y02_00795 [Rhodobacterales bacterium 17-64-5]